MINNEREIGTGAGNANLGAIGPDGRLLAKIMGLVGFSVALSMLSGYIVAMLGIDWAVVFIITLFFSLSITCFILSTDPSG